MRAKVATLHMSIPQTYMFTRAATYMHPSTCILKLYPEGLHHQTPSRRFERGRHPCMRMRIQAQQVGVVLGRQEMAISL